MYSASRSFFLNDIWSFKLKSKRYLKNKEYIALGFLNQDGGSNKQNNINHILRQLQQFAVIPKHIRVLFEKMKFSFVFIPMQMSIKT